ncbi:hypothetical protein JRQ81_014667 [Phrynocephalus forsythii]|uniref:Uncharacterized protein n=1 Tax=Phrynocephalus forsythii TaxID=171643 RepID=A0A9Q0Y0E2_9SAUR|nr:hypothetical protein JRQ81_014667 [Phrynocephalus forsythii]
MSRPQRRRMKKIEVEKTEKELKNIDIKGGGRGSDEIAGEKEGKVTGEIAVREKGVTVEGFRMIDRKVSECEVKKKEVGRYKRVTVDEAIQTDPEKQDRGSQVVEDGQPIVKIEKASMTQFMSNLPLTTPQYHNPVARGKSFGAITFTRDGCTIAASPCGQDGAGHSQAPTSSPPSADEEAEISEPSPHKGSDPASSRETSKVSSWLWRGEGKEAPPGPGPSCCPLPVD